MRSLTCALLLAVMASGAAAQPPTSGARQRVDSLLAATPLEPDCVARGPVGALERPADSLCLGKSDVVRMAIERNPAIRAGEEQVAQAHARKVQGTAIPDPQFGAELDQATASLGNATAKVVGATLQIPFPDKFRLQAKIGNADIQSTQAGLELLRQQVASAASQTYDSLLAALRRRRDLTEARALAADFLTKTQARFQAGTVARLDVIKAQVAVGQAENDLISTEHDVATARSALNRLLDRPLDAPTLASDSLAVPGDLPPLAALEPAALASRPEIASLQRQREGARANTALAKEYWLPDLIVGLGKDYADPGPGILTAGIAVPLPVFFWQHSKGEIAESKHHERELDATLRDAQSFVGQELRAIYAQAQTALAQARYLRDQLLPATREAFRIASVSYGLGGSSALDVLDARQALLDAENQYTDALATANMGRAELERAVGRRLDGIGGSR